MTIPNPEPVVPDVPVKEAEAHAVEKVDEHTPTPATNPVPEVHEKTDDGLDALRDTVNGLAASVAALTDLVTKKVVDKDEAPASVPWTHRGGASHRSDD